MKSGSNDRNSKAKIKFFDYFVTSNFILLIPRWKSLFYVETKYVIRMSQHWNDASKSANFDFEVISGNFRESELL